MKRLLRGAAVVVAVAGSSVALGAVYAYLRRGGTSELQGFFVWSLPLDFTVAAFASQPRFPRLRPGLRAAAVTAFGCLAGVLWTLVGWLLIGGWMLAWDFPVLYCWALAGALGAVGSAVADGTIALTPAGLGLGSVVATVVGLWLYGTRPEPAVLIVYRESPDFDAAQRVLDSVLTRPYRTGVGRETIWPTTTYSRTQTAKGETAALIGVREPASRDSIRAVLRNHPLVSAVIDTVIRRR
jgi:hypothetical protein